MNRLGAMQMPKAAKRLDSRGRVRSAFQPIGLALVLVPHMYSWTVGAAIGLDSFWGIAFFILLGACCILFGSKSNGTGNIVLIFAKFPSVSVMLVWILVAGLLNGGSKEGYWLLFVIFYFGLMSFVSISTKNYFVEIFSASVLLPTAIFIMKGAGDFAGLAGAGQYGRYSITEGNEAYSLVSYAAALSAVCSLYCTFLIKKRSLFWLIGTLLSLWAIFMSGTRSVYIGVILCLFYLAIAFFRSISLKDFGKGLLILLIVGLVALVAASSESVSGAFLHLWESIQRSYFTIIGEGSEEIDDSSLGRIFQREEAVNLFFDYPLTGAGYKRFWVDFPLLQAFSDLGLFFGLLFIVNAVILPLYACLSAYRTKYPWAVLLCLVYIVNMPRLFLHGQPYDWATLAFVFLPYALLLKRRALKQVFDAANSRGPRSAQFSNKI